MLALSFSLRGAEAKNDAAPKPVSKEAPVKLDPVRAEANPFADWGIGGWGSGPLFFGITGRAPKEMFVMFVSLNSPADVAGVSALDQIIAVDGRAITQLPWREFVKQVRDSEKGDVVKLTLSRWNTGISREVELKIGSNRNWVRDDGVERYNLWGVIVSLETPKKVTGTPNPKMQRVTMAEVPVMQIRRIKNAKNTQEPVFTEDGKPVTKLQPIPIVRRVVTLSYAGRKLTLIDRENGVVEVIEGGSAPKNDDVVGRLLQQGATLTLRADGTFEIQDAPPKLNPPVTPPAELPASAAPAASGP